MKLLQKKRKEKEKVIDDAITTKGGLESSLWSKIDWISKICLSSGSKKLRKKKVKFHFNGIHSPKSTGRITGPSSVTPPTMFGHVFLFQFGRFYPCKLLNALDEYLRRADRLWYSEATIGRNASINSNGRSLRGIHTLLEKESTTTTTPTIKTVAAITTPEVLAIDRPKEGLFLQVTVFRRWRASRKDVSLAVESIGYRSCKLIRFRARNSREKTVRWWILIISEERVIKRFDRNGKKN